MEFKYDTGQGPSSSSVIVRGNNNPNETEDFLDPLETALVINQYYQLQLQQMVCRLHNDLDANREEQRIIAEKLNKSKNQGVKNCRRPITLFAAPYFRDVKGRYPPENEDTLLKRNQNDFDAYTVPQKQWLKKEEATLALAVYSIARQQEALPYVNKKTYLFQKMKRDKLSDDELKRTHAIIDELNNYLEEIKNKSELELINSLSKEIDWLQVSTVYMRGHRSPDECETKWATFLHPGINRKKFTEEEKIKLKKLSAKYGEKNWDLIAQKLGTNRTAFQCFQRYQNGLNPNLVRKYWTPDEDEQLLSTVNNARIGNRISWHKVIYSMPGRSRLQIRNRWDRSIQPESQTRAWTVEEDAVLYGAYQVHPEKWVKMTEYLPGRSNYHLRQRYINKLAPNLKSGGWTLEEDRILLKLVAKFGSVKWSVVSKFLPNRTDSSCAMRFVCLKAGNKLAVASMIRKFKAGKQKDEVIMKRQIVKSKRGFSISEKRQIREKAVEKLDEAVLKWFPHLHKDPESELWDLSGRVLKKISDELLESSWAKELTFRQPSYKVLERSLRAQAMEIEENVDDVEEDDDDEEEMEDEEEEEMQLNDTEEESDSESSEDVSSVENGNESDEDEDAQFTQEDKKQIDEELENLFKPLIAAGITKVKKHIHAKPVKDILEYEVVKSMLFKAFHVKGEELPNVMHKGVDYATSVQDVMSRFVIPTPDVTSFPALPPNHTTVGGMFTICKALEHIEQQWVASNCKHSPRTLFNLNAIVSDKKDANHKCWDCSKDNEHDTSDEKKDCECEVLKKLRERYLLLKRNCMSIFLWPALLSAAPLSTEQVDTLIRKEIFTGHSLTSLRQPYEQKGVPSRKGLSSAKRRSMVDII